MAPYYYNNKFVAPYYYNNKFVAPYYYNNKEGGEKEAQKLPQHSDVGVLRDPPPTLFPPAPSFLLYNNVIII